MTRHRICPALWLLIALFVGPTRAAEEPWRPLLPNGWLAVAVTHDVEATEKKFASLLDDVGLQYNSVFASLKQAAGVGGFEFEAGELVLGLAKPGPDAPAYWFALVPAREFATFVQAVGGEMTGDLGVVTLLGVDLCLAPCGDWAIVTSLDQLAVAEKAMQKSAQATAQATKASDLAIELSAAGIELLITRADEQDDALRNRSLRGALVWPPKLEAVDAALAQNLPLLRRWSTLLDGLRAEATLDDAGELRVVLSAPLREPPTGAAKPAAAALAQPPAGPGIIELTGSGASPFAKPLLELYLAYLNGRPDVVDAKRFPAQSYTEFSQAVAAVFGQVEGFSSRLVEHVGADAPLYSNQAAVVSVADGDAFLDATRNVVSKWNALVAEAEPEVDLQFETKPIKLADCDGLLLDVDMVEAMKLGVSAEMRQIMHQFFGGQGRYAWRALKLSDSRVLLMDLPKQQAEAVARQLAKQPALGGNASPPKADSSWQANVRMDRYLTWQRRVQRVMRGVEGDAVQPTQPRPATLDMQLTTRGGKLELRACTSRKSLRTLGEMQTGSR